LPPLFHTAQYRQKSFCDFDAWLQWSTENPRVDVGMLTGQQSGILRLLALLRQVEHQDMRRPLASGPARGEAPEQFARCQDCPLHLWISKPHLQLLSTIRVQFCTLRATIVG
jgi:hypothetical protein